MKCANTMHFCCSFLEFRQKYVAFWDELGSISGFFSTFVVFFKPKIEGKPQTNRVFVFDFSQQQRAKGVGMAFKLKNMTGGASSSRISPH